MDGEELTEQETALYDRQIRVWGADAQRRLSKSHILIYGMTGTVAEFCKNIVLAGVGSVTLVDERVVAEESLSANFLILPVPDENLYQGKTLAEFRVALGETISSEGAAGDILTFGVEFFEKFDAVILSCCSLRKKKWINQKCRKLSKRVAFYTVECRGSCGEIFVDLQDYKFSKLKKLEETIECRIEYPSLEEAISVPWRALPRSVSKLYFAMRVIEHFEYVEGRDPGETIIDDLPGILELRKELCETNSLDESQIPDALLERLVRDVAEYPPVCAIVGGILGQEVIKAISGNGVPLKNFFFFDAMDGKGLIEDISVPSSPS
ncbi:hypothetical protein V6N13_061248 [Hibiscus sabdariffa]|uniref:Ubiquitin-like 1-activating enzyme E1A n=2 Tax=Hibiscus sabdariffa TaxID=183260 RepID=A0ABR1ZAG5_9ROSI